MMSRRTFMLQGAVAVGALALPVLPRQEQLDDTRRTVIVRSSFLMGSVCTFRIYCDDARNAHRAVDQAITEIRDLEELMSVFKPDSQVSQINRHSGRREISVDPCLIEVLLGARAFHAVTSGAFDITIEPLMKLYGFRSASPPASLPTVEAVRSAMGSVGMNNICIDTHRSSIIVDHASTQIDLGGMGVGYALDRAGGILRRMGVDAALINHSGDLLAIGAPPGDTGWEIELEDPLNPGNTYFRLNIKNQSLSTSGCYRSFIQTSHGKIGHILDPKTGDSPDSIESITVVAETAMEADALSTGCFVLGPDASMALMKSRCGLSVIGMAMKNGIPTMFNSYEN